MGPVEPFLLQMSSVACDGVLVEHCALNERDDKLFVMILVCTTPRIAGADDEME